MRPTERKYRTYSDIVLWVVFMLNLILHIANTYLIEDRERQWHYVFLQVTFSLFFFSMEHVVKRFYYRQYDVSLLLSIVLAIFFGMNFIGVTIGFNMEHEGFRTLMYIFISVATIFTIAGVKRYR